MFFQIYIWDLKDPTKPYSPGNRSSKLDEITSVAWNNHVQYVLAASSSTGYTVVWDLRGKREVAGLVYGGGTGTLSGPPGYPTGGMAVGGRRGMSDVAWHPDNVRTAFFLLSIVRSTPFLYFRRLRGWLLLLKTTCPRSSWFGIYETPALQKEY